MVMAFVNQCSNILTQVELPDWKKEEAFTYFMVKLEEEDKRPSYVYKYVIVIVRGAEEHNIRQEYLDWLRGIEDNGYRGDVNDVGLDLKERSKIKDWKL